MRLKVEMCLIKVTFDSTDVVISPQAQQYKTHHTFVIILCSAEAFLYRQWHADI